MLNNIGLYYPFIQFNMGGQEEWLKLAVLYWDKLGRIALPEYNIRDTETVQQLVSDLGFIINFEPSQGGNEQYWFSIPQPAETAS